MNIVHVEDFFHPDAGYQINILPKYMAKMGHKVIIVTSEMGKVPDNLTKFFGKENIEIADKIYEEETGVKIIRLPIRSFISGRAVFKSSIFKQIDAMNPDILYVHGNDTLIGIQYTLRRKKLKYPLVLDSHMLEMASKNRFNTIFRKMYKKIITPIIVKNEIKVIRTQNDNYVEKFLGIPLNLSPWISVGSDTMLFYENSENRTIFRKNNDILDEDFVILYTGKLDDSKGGKFLAETFEKKFQSIKGKVVLVIVGNSQGIYGKELESNFKESENRIIRFSTQKYVDLPVFYQAADLCVFPKQCSLSFYDAQACGLPVISENNNINFERLKHDNGLVFTPGNVLDFRAKIENVFQMNKEEYCLMKKNASNHIKKNYDYEGIAHLYMNIIMNEINIFKGIKKYK